MSGVVKMLALCRKLASVSTIVALTVVAAPAVAEIEIVSSVELPILDGPVEFVHISARGDTIVAGGATAGVRVWRRIVEDWVHVAEVDPDSCLACDAAWAESAGLVILECAHRGLVAWRLEDGPQYLIPPENGAWSVDDLATWSVSGDGRLLGAVFEPGTFTLWDTSTGLEAAPPHPNSSVHTQIRFSHDGRHVAIDHGYTPSSLDAQITVFETEGMTAFGWMPWVSRPYYFDRTGALLIGAFTANDPNPNTGVWDVRRAAMVYFDSVNTHGLAARLFVADHDPDDLADVSSVVWAHGDALDEQPVSKVCEGWWHTYATDLPAVVAAREDEIFLCDALDGSVKTVAVYSTPRSFHVAERGRHAVAGMEDGRVVVMEFRRAGR